MLLCILFMHVFFFVSLENRDWVALEWLLTKFTFTEKYIIIHTNRNKRSNQSIAGNLFHSFLLIQEFLFNTSENFLYKYIYS